MHRKLPWRMTPSLGQDPYRAWLAEVMLQQTTVVTVTPYYNKFLKLWPNVQAMAKAPEEDILREWAGLGYYSRARNLHRCAVMVTKDYKGVFPKNAKELEALPGIGPYTASAVAAMAYGERVVPVDGNIERVMARLHALKQPPIKIKSDIRALAQQELDGAPDVFPGDYAQALMDLGATVCTPKAPKCGVCPIAGFCRAKALGAPEAFPVTLPKQIKPKRQGVVYMIRNAQGAVMVEKRADKGLLAGMVGLPGSDWVMPGARTTDPWAKGLTKLRHIGDIRHSFTHFDLHLKVVEAQWKGPKGAIYRWVASAQIDHVGLPKVFRKVVDLRPDLIQGTKKK